MTGCNKRAIVRPAVDLPDIGENGGMGRHQEIGRVEQRSGRRVMHEPEAAKDASVVAFVGFQDRQERNLMAAPLKFRGKVNVVEKGPAEVGHLPAEEQDFHCGFPRLHSGLFLARE
jgi:hypothetical protein